MEKKNRKKGKDISGNKYGSLTAIRIDHVERFEDNKKNTTHWLCRCNCGKEVVVKRKYLTSGETKSCGSPKHRYKYIKHTKKLRSYTTWWKMMARCYDKSHVSYKHYGGRGITVCKQWRNRKNGFANFFSDMGERPVGMTLERIDNDKGYSIENCRWATYKEQARNTSQNVWITINGRTKLLKDWRDKLSLSVDGYYYWRRKGHTPEQIIGRFAKERLSDYGE